MDKSREEEDRVAALAEFLGTHITENKRSLIAKALENRTRRLTVLLEDVYQPHNASACLRNCDCLGIQDLHIVEGRHAYRPTEGISMGSLKWLTLRRHQSTGEALSALRSAGYRIVATSPAAASHTPLTLPLDRPVALLFGTEKHGLSAEAVAAADDWLRLPMYGFTESYNLSVAVALALSRLVERLRSGPDSFWQLSPLEKNELKLAWYRKLIRRHPELEAEFLRGKD